MKALQWVLLGLLMISCLIIDGIIYVLKILFRFNLLGL